MTALSANVQARIQELKLNEQDLVSKKPVKAAEPLDKSHPLASYYVSTSHNTYLSDGQLHGTSTSATYKHVLENEGRVVEIDAWDHKDDKTPCVYHGWTLTKPVPTQDVITTIGEAVKSPNDLPIIISLENHCSPPVQDKLAVQFRDLLGDKLVHSPIPGKTNDHITLQEVCGRVLVKVEHYGVFGVHEKEAPAPDQAREPKPEVDLSSSDESGDEEEKNVKKQKKQKVKITPTLAELGVYTQSMKPPKGPWWLDQLFHPMKRVVNISETTLLSILPTSVSNILDHTANHLMRVYPKGTRITSMNLDPLPFWRAGCQLVALNWQRFDLGMELNTALFEGTGGWVLKPSHLRERESIGKDARAAGKTKRKLKLTIDSAGHLPDIEDCPSWETMKAYVKADIVSSQGKKRHTTKVAKNTKEAKGREPVWQDKAEFEWDDEHLVFFRIRIMHDDNFGSRDDKIVSFCALVDRLEQGWQLLPLRDDKGHPSEARMLVNIELS